MDLILQSIQLTRNRGFALFIVPILLGLMFMAAAKFNPTNTVAKIIFYGLAVVFTGLGLKMLVYSFSIWNPENSPIIKMLKNDPTQIVWAYETQFKSRHVPTNLEFQASNVYLMLANGKKYNFTTKAADIKPILEYILSVAPAAFIGYSPEIKQRYTTNPSQVAGSGLPNTWQPDVQSAGRFW